MGPSLVECLTYRYSGHSRADPAKYRPAGELEKWKERDPVATYRKRLEALGFPSTTLDAIDAELQRMIDDATKACESAPSTSVDILFTDVYADGGCSWRN